MDSTPLYAAVHGRHGARRSPYPRQERRRVLQPGLGRDAREATSGLRVRAAGLHHRGGMQFQCVVFRRAGTILFPGASMYIGVFVRFDAQCCIEGRLTGGEPALHTGSWRHVA